MSVAAPVRNERGFVLVLVLFVMAALTVTVSGALLVTQSDQAAARASVDSNRAFHVAQAGLIYFIGDRSASRSDSVVYQISGGRVVVRARRIAVSGLEEVHEISARASVYSRGRQSEVREVRQLAVLDLRPFNPPGALGAAVRNLTLSGNYSGTDQSMPGQCLAAARGSRTGLVGVTGGIVSAPGANGYPRTEFEADTAAFRRRMSSYWQELMDPATPFDYEYTYPGGTWPNFAALAAGAYPSIRVRGDLFADSMFSGRGMLIVEGRIGFGPNFVWDGVIMSGGVAATMQTNAYVRGSVMLGLAPGSTTGLTIDPDSRRGSANLAYDACKVMAAARGIARFRLLPNTWWEP